MAQLGLQLSLINLQTTFLFRKLNVEKQEKVHITNSVTISDCSQTQRYSGFNIWKQKQKEKQQMVTFKKL